MDIKSIRQRARQQFFSTYLRITLVVTMQILSSRVIDELLKLCLTESTWFYILTTGVIKILIAPLFIYGAANIYLRAWRAEPFDWRQLIAPISTKPQYRRATGMALIMQLPSIALTAVTVILSIIDAMNLAYTLLYLFLIILLLCVVVWIQYRLYLVYYAGLIDPELKVLAAIRLSADAMKGQFGNYFVLGLSTLWPIFVILLLLFFVLERVNMPGIGIDIVAQLAMVLYFGYIHIASAGFADIRLKQYAEDPNPHGQSLNKKNAE